MRSLFRPLSLVAFAIFLLPGCSLLQKFQQKLLPARQVTAPQNPKSAQCIGTVIMVNIESAFVLIDNGSRPSPTKGTGAQSRSADGSSVELRLTEIRKRPFLIADIVAGTPQKGDQVFQ